MSDEAIWRQDGAGFWDGGGFTYLAAANDQHFLGLDLPGEDEAASALDLWELVLLWAHAASQSTATRSDDGTARVLRSSLVSTVGIGCVTDDLKWPPHNRKRAANRGWVGGHYRYQ